MHFYNLPIIPYGSHETLRREKRESDRIIVEARKRLPNPENQPFIQFLETGTTTAHNKRMQIKDIVEQGLSPNGQATDRFTSLLPTQLSFLSSKDIEHITPASFSIALQPRTIELFNQCVEKLGVEKNEMGIERIAGIHIRNTIWTLIHPDEDSQQSLKNLVYHEDCHSLIEGFFQRTQICQASQ